MRKIVRASAASSSAPAPAPEAYQCHGNNVGPMGTLRRGNGGLTGGVPFVATEQPPWCEGCKGTPGWTTCGSSTWHQHGEIVADNPCTVQVCWSCRRPARRAYEARTTDARYWETRVARNGRGGQLDTVANALKAEAGSTGMGDAAPMVLQQTYNIVPEWGGGADLRAIESDISNAVTVTDHAKKTDRGIRVVTRAYEVDKERGIPNPEGIRVNETTTSPTITATGDPTERTDRGLRVLAPTLTASNDPSRSPQSSEITAMVESVIQASTAVRRLTPTECERLQGFPDGWTVVPPAPRKKKGK